jgi:hypothetical protein
MNISYLLLGDGDFTYSLDLCRYIASLDQTANKIGATLLYSITCTGVDTLEELRTKYKDADFVLRNIRQCSNSNDDSSKCDAFSSNEGANVRVVTRILHGINAVQSQESTSEDEDDSPHLQSPLKHFDHVMFHHPHLGKEDAQLHTRFLHHLFHAVNTRWLKPGRGATCRPELNSSEIQGGLFYLTLVMGQCRRWKCIEAAKKHGLVLLRRVPFCPPPAAAGFTTYYQLRRHQSGKSFAKRRRMQQHQQMNEQTVKDNDASSNQNDSETLVFGRACDYAHLISADDDHCSTERNSSIGKLPWESDSTEPDSHSQNASSSISFVCPYCPKSFHEERSLKNHMINTHSDCPEVAAWTVKKSKKNKKCKPTSNDYGDDEKSNAMATQRNNNDAPLTCSMCEESNNARTFPHQQALLDHQRAKHFGSHNDIKPDWCSLDIKSNSNANDDNGSEIREVSIEKECNQEGSHVGKCTICGVSYMSEAEKIKHNLEFVPSISMANVVLPGNLLDESVDYKCNFCKKQFRGLRAQRQHENFCFTAKTAPL